MGNFLQPVLFCQKSTIAACILLRFGLDDILAGIDAENNNNIGSCRSLSCHGSHSCWAKMQKCAQYMWRTAAEVEEQLAESSHEVGTPENRSNGMRHRVPKYIIMAGLPGSGKISLSKRLSLNDGRSKNKWVHASANGTGTRACCTVVRAE